MNSSTQISQAPTQKQPQFIPAHSQSPPVDVFISHSSEESEAARRLAHAIRSYGLSVWTDVENMLPGPDWSEEIESNLWASRLIVPLISASTYPRGRLSQEWMSILERFWENPDTPILPVVLDEVNLPKFLSGRHYFHASRRPADLEQAAQIIARFMASPQQVVSSLSYKPVDLNEREERFRALHNAILEIKNQK